jgi:hypothetical protein
MATVEFLVQVDKSRRSSIDQVAKALEDKGVKVKYKLPRFGTILGSGDSSQIEELRSVEGVELVRPQHKFQLPPMDEKTPQ